MRTEIVITETQWAAVKEYVESEHPKIGVVVSQFHPQLTEYLEEGALQLLQEAGVFNNKLVMAYAPGAFELPVIAQNLITEAECQAVICLGVVIKGDTPHFDYVCQEAARGIQQVSLTTGCPVIFGVITTTNYEQAELRCNPKKDNKGAYAAWAALQTLQTITSFNSL